MFVSKPYVGGLSTAFLAGSLVARVGLGSFVIKKFPLLIVSLFVVGMTSFYSVAISYYLYGEPICSVGGRGISGLINGRKMKNTQLMTYSV